VKEFLTIFLALCLGAGGFMTGRNYGEKTFRETDEYKNLISAQEELKFTRAELETVKTEAQNIAERAIANHVKLEPAVIKVPVEKTVPSPKKVFDANKLRSYEWILTNSQNREDVQKNLKNVEIKDLNLFLASAKETPVESFEPIFGTYRGRMFDIDKKEYASMLMKINAVPKGDGNTFAKGEVRLFNNGNETLGSDFETETLGYIVSGTHGFLINPAGENKFWQLYKVKDTQQLTGYMYEKSALGKTRTIGSFVLNRTDKF